MMPTAEMIWAFVGQFGITVVVAIGAAWALFRYLGDKWITKKFGENLEAFKHAQAQEIEKLRLKINTAFDRTVKLHNQEFEVLPEIWTRMIDAYSASVAFVSPLQSHPDLDRLKGAELEHFLSQSKLHDYQKWDIRNANSKLEIYIEMIFWHTYREVDEKRRRFEEYQQTRGLFIQDVLQVEIKEVADLIWDALNEARFEKQHPNPRVGRYEKAEKLRAEGPARCEAIGKAIKSKLWESASL
jgi:hypothetical protein